MDNIFDFPSQNPTTDPAADVTLELPRDLPHPAETANRSRNLCETWINDDPPPRQFLVDRLIPLGEVGRVIAPGGTGKSMMVLQLATSVATGIPWLGKYPVPETGGVLILNSEDDETELHRRFHTINQTLKSHSTLINPKHWRRIYPMPVRGRDMRLVQTVAGNPQRCEDRIRWIIEAAKAADAKLIIMDPQASFYGGEENSNREAQVFTEILRHIAKATGATVLVVHHANKASGTNGSTEQGTSRGASAFTDGARFELVMATMIKDNAKAYGIDEAKRRSYVRIDLPKANYCEPWGGAWLQRGVGGYLSTVELRMVKKETKAENPELLNSIISVIREHAKQGKHYSRRKFAEDFASTNAVQKAGRDAIRTALNVLIEEGAVVLGKPPDGSCHHTVSEVLFAVGEADFDPDPKPF